MRLAHLAGTVFAVTLAIASAATAAADANQPPARSTPGMMGHGAGMMGYGPGMMSPGAGMMGCPMMSGGMMGRGMMPMLPPGNEKLQMQMQAEIMQKVGEIMAKYANQIQPAQ